MSQDPQDKLRATLVRAAREVERLREKVAALERAATEPIAVIGVGLRLPGGAHDLDSLWTLLEHEIDAVDRIPRERWDADKVYDPDPERPGKTHVREAAFISDVDLFDPAFFKISPREAASLDPQHRMLLEASWQALEHGRLIPSSLIGSATGVYVGIGPSDYSRFRHPGDLDAYAATGTHMSFSAGRVAFHLGLQGPAMSVDTACSSSLVALHLACNALRAGECDIALAAGVQVMLAPEPFIALSKTRAVAPDGRSKTFSANADGYGRGEGVIVLAMTRLSDAQAKEHRILALVRGSAVNHDGTSSGITAPNGSSQQIVLRAAIDNAGLVPADIDVVECHGTGTKLGDPIEVQALAAVYGEGRPAERPLLLGAIKTNIGHLESAAGLAGVAKVIAAMRHRALPATIHTTPRNPHIDWDSLPVEVVAELRPWHRRADAGPRRAGVSALGLSGTNAHVILEEPPRVTTVENNRLHSPPPSLPLVVSGRSASALTAQIQLLREHLDTAPELRPLDLAFSLATTRSPFEHRAALLASDASSLSASARISTAHARSAPKLALLFTGQGSQRAGMGEALRRAYPSFRATFDAICERFDSLLDEPLRAAILAPGHTPEALRLDQTGYAQPALFTFEVALFHLFESWGVVPHLLLGHSIGEITAAHIAGILSLDDACKLVAARGRLMQALPTGGAMISVAASESEVSTELRQISGVDIAGLNGPMSTVISGDEAPVLALARRFEARGREIKRLNVSHAFHSHRMDAMLEDFREVAESSTFSPPKIPIVSNVTGELATAQELCTPAYWVRHVRATVRFLAGVRTLEDQNIAVCLELGPHGVLSAMAAACLSPRGQEQTAFVAASRRDRPETETIALAVGDLHCHGISVDWEAYFGPFGPKRVDLPTYAFQRQRCWQFDTPHHTPQAIDLASSGLVAVNHPFLRAMTSIADSDSRLFTGSVSLASFPWLGDHRVFNRPVFPGTAFAELALAAAREIWPSSTSVGLDELTLIAPLLLDGETTFIQVVLDEDDADGHRTFTIYSRPDASMDQPPRAHATGRAGPTTNASRDAPTWPPPHASALDLRRVYPRFDELGLSYGPLFRGLRRAWRSAGGDLYAEVSIEAAHAEGFGIHPALFDAALHLASFATDTKHLAEAETLALPFAMRDLRLHAAGPSSVRVRARVTGPDNSLGAFDFWDPEGAPVARLGSIEARPAKPEQLQHLDFARDLYRVTWEPLSSSSGRQDTEPGRWAIVGSDATARQFADQMSAASFPDWDALVTALSRGDLEPDVVVRCWTDPAPTSVATLHATTDAALAELKDWLTHSALTSTRLLWITSHAIGTSKDEQVPSLTHAPLWGLARCARNEAPQRAQQTLDIDVGHVAPSYILDVLASSESEFVLRAGALQVQRLRPLEAPSRAVSADYPDLDGVTLITGGTGQLGAHLARHLVRTHRARHLVLTSRRGLDAPGAAELHAELVDLGAEDVRIAACDVADYESLAELLESVTGRRPLVAVFHVAGVLDDALIINLTSAQLHEVLRPKIDGAWNLHTLTKKAHPRSTLTMFSSVAGILGNPGQSSYAAGNTFLDALAHHRFASGLPGLSLAWGLWAEGGMLAHLDDADLARLRGQGVRPISISHGLRLLDASQVLDEPLTVPVSLDVRGLRKRQRYHDLPPLLRHLVPRGLRQLGSEHGGIAGAHEGASWSRALRGSSPERAFQVVIGELGVQLEAVLHVDPNTIDSDTSFGALGIDSLMALELITRLSRVTGLTLPTTYLFDHTTPGSVARDIVTRLRDAEGTTRSPEASDDGWREDLHLVDDLEFPARAPEEPLSELLLTGVTGFLGPHMLAELLAATEHRIHVLIRAEDSRGAWARLGQAFDQWQLDRKLLDTAGSRVLVHAGDLCVPQLGLEDETWTALTQRVDLIIGNGAIVDWHRPYDGLRETNVLGVRHLLDLAAAGKAKRFAHVSSIVACHARGDGRLMETVGHERPMSNMGYAWTKYVGERLVLAACEHGLDVVIMRPAGISSSSRTGVPSPGQIEFRFLRACVELGAVPDTMISLDLTPVDVVAAMGVEAALNPRVSGVLHLAQLCPYSPRWLSEVIRSLGWRSAVIDTYEWQRLLEARIVTGDLEFAPLRSFASVLHGDAIFDTSRTRGLLNSSQNLPNPTESLVLALATAAKSGLLRHLAP